MTPELFTIDQHRLDEEWLAQSKLFFDAAVDLATKRQRHEEAKAAKDVTIAELDRKIRRDPEVYGINRLSEMVIERVTRLQEEYAAADQRVRKRRHAVDIAQAYVDALDHRKKALENLVHLHAQNYFSTPKAPTEATQEHISNVRKTKARTRR